LDHLQVEFRAFSVYNHRMTKADIRREATGKWVVRDPRNGRFVEVRGANSMKPSKLEVAGDIDLTKPIAEQVLARPQPQSSAARTRR
jgi:hypothetical protein